MCVFLDMAVRKHQESTLGGKPRFVAMQLADNNECEKTALFCLSRYWITVRHSSSKNTPRGRVRQDKND